MPFPSIPLFVMPRDFALADLMQYTVDLYRPSTIASESMGDIEGADYSYSVTAAYTGILACYEPTPEFDDAKTEGITKEVNILTSDKWHFLAEQEILDTWLIVLRGPAGHPYVGRCWVTQGNSFENASVPGRPADSQWIYAKLSPTPLIP